MAKPLKLMCVLAHPDDESMGTGGILAKYAQEGIETYLVTATRGERGWNGSPEDYPGLEGLGKLREAELLAAAKVLGIRQVDFLDYIDGDLDQAPHTEAIAKIVCCIRRVKPQVVVSFGPDGGYGHPDHIAISQFTTTAVMCAADAGFADPDQQAPHRVSKLYYMAVSPELASAYTEAFGDISMTIDGVERHVVAWEDWAVTTQIDAKSHWQTVWNAVACHRTQLPNYDQLVALDEAVHQRLWGSQPYYRVFSFVNGGRAVEQDMFAGLR